jgi:hypothetical protein
MASVLGVIGVVLTTGLPAVILFTSLFVHIMGR